MGRYKLDDKVATCNYILSHRKSNKELRSKGMIIKISKDLYAKTTITYRPSTDVFTLTHCLVYNITGAQFYPSTNQKRKCTNKHSLNLLYKDRERNKLYYRNKKKEESSVIKNKNKI